MRTWEDFWQENAKKIAENRDQGKGGGGGGGAMSMFGGGGGEGSEGYKGMMGKGLFGSGKFSAAELKQGYRKV